MIRIIEPNPAHWNFQLYFFFLFTKYPPTHLKENLSPRLNYKTVQNIWAARSSSTLEVHVAIEETEWETSKKAEESWGVSSVTLSRSSMRKTHVSCTSKPLGLGQATF